MYCARCGRKYGEGEAQCLECHAALVPGTPAGSQQEPVMVFESSNPFVTAMAKGALEDSGIPFWMQGEETYTRQIMGPLAFLPNRFLVPPDREAEARELLQQLEAPIEENDVQPPIPQ